MSESQQESRLNISVDSSEFSKVLADRLEEMADAGVTLGPDDLRDWVARLRGSEAHYTLRVDDDGLVTGNTAPPNE